MRPHELTLDGFRSYAEATTISWEGRRLVGIVGPIGSGKSSILDGISFALYGRTPRVERDVKGLINQRRDEGKVALTFSVDGTVWRVVRALRRRGQSAHALYLIEGGEEIEISDKAREVSDRITELLGLDFDGFRRSVLLAQNQFAGFLEATSGKRNDVLKGVFGFERLDGMRAAARAGRDGAAAELTALERLRDQAEQDRKGLAEARADGKVAAEAVERLERAREPVSEQDGEISNASEQLRALELERQRLSDVSERIPDREATEALLGAEDEIRARIAEAESEAALAAEKEAAAAATAEEAATRTGGHGALTDARALLARHDEQARAAERAAQQVADATAAVKTAGATAKKAAAAVDKAAAGHERAVKALGKAQSGVEQAETAFHEATHRDVASALRRELHDGDRCPVCEQQIDQVPAPTDAGLEEAGAGLESAKIAAEAARGTEGEASRLVVSLRAEAKASAEEAERSQSALDRATTAGEEASREASATLSEAKALLGDPKDPMAALRERAQLLGDADKALAEARSVSAAFARLVDEARKEAGTTRTRLDSLLTQLADLAARLGVDDLDLTGGSADLREALRALREAWVRRTSEIGVAVEEATTRRTVAEQLRKAALGEAGLEADSDLSEATAGARERKATIDGRIADLEARLADLKRLEKEQADLIARRDRYQRLFDDLSPAKFPAFVLDDRRRALAALGSERFEYLSAGRYRFTDDGEFHIVDLSAADRTRSAASLSGGETFLASLALALALAEIVAREGGRLDAFFLDEGFGSLDVEHIELAMAGIERLVTEGPDRLIVVVSHVAGLRDRLEDLIVLTKDEVTGDTRVTAGADVPG